MKVTETSLPGVLLFEPQVFGDQRGYFMESWNHERYSNAGLKENFVQDNISYSQQGILRGLHVQNPFPQGKLVHVLEGAVFDVAVDIRVGSPTFGQWVGVTLSAENHHQLYIPAGFAHGFCVTSETAMFAYKCTDSYHPETELSIRWDDPDLAINWPTTQPLLSKKDAEAKFLRDIDENRLPEFK